MKNLLILLTMAFIVMSCSQNNCSNGQLDSGELSVDCGGNCPPCPITTTPPVQQVNVLCEGVYTYEIIAGTALATGDRLELVYTEFDGVQNGYLILNGTGSAQVTIVQPNPYYIYSVSMAIALIGSDPNLTIQNTVIMNIYQDGNLVATSGTVPVQLCFKGSTSPTSCAPGIQYTDTLVFICN